MSQVWWVGLRWAHDITESIVRRLSALPLLQCDVMVAVLISRWDVLGLVSLFIFGIFYLVCFESSVPVQVIAWKDSSPKWFIRCRAGRKTLLTHSLAHLGLHECIHQGIFGEYVLLLVCLLTYLVTRYEVFLRVLQLHEFCILCFLSVDCGIYYATDNLAKVASNWLKILPNC